LCIRTEANHHGCDTDAGFGNVGRKIFPAVRTAGQLHPVPAGGGGARIGTQSWGHATVSSLEDAPAKTESSEEPGAEPGPSGPSKEPADKTVVVGSLRTTPEDKWTCKVPSCTGSFHRLKDCRFFHSMKPEDRVELMEHHDLCLGCLTPGHGRTARSCP
jgi:hypothetical protein